MKFKRPVVVASAFVLALATASAADNLGKRHGAGLRMGMWNMSTDARVDLLEGSVSTSVGSSGFLAGVAYNYWLSESVALDIDASVMQADVETRVGLLDVSTQASSVTSVLLGLKYYFPASTYGGSVRPFAKGAIGPFSGNQSASNVGLTVSVESRSETAFGGQLGGGVDFILSRRFLLGVNLGYNLMSDFGMPIGGSINYGGPIFNVGLSFLFGRGRS